MQREYGISPHAISTYTFRELAAVSNDRRALEEQRAADRQHVD